jgi:dTDP-4-amino-4,6-dideoxy-D-galactose acyltransferase
MMIEPDAWLAAIFGHPVYRVEAGEGNPPSAGEILEAACRGPALFYARVPVDRIEKVARLTGIGFHIVDVTITFEREPAPLDDIAGSPFTIRRASPGDRDRVLGIAGSCFVHSRFHADSLIPRRTADAVKREWVASYFAGRRGEGLFVVDEAGEPAGFLAVMAEGSEGKRTRIIDLIGVDSRFQGRGAGTSLVAFFVRDSVGGFTRLRVGTQIANVPSLRLYENCGFRIAGAAYVLHAHVLDGELVGSSG